MKKQQNKVVVFVALPDMNVLHLRKRDGVTYKTFLSLLLLVELNLLAQRYSCNKFWLCMHLFNIIIDFPILKV